MKALILDFDGVISDSAPEAFVMAVRTYTELRSESNFGLSLGHLTSSTATLKDVRNTSLYWRFLELMPLGNRAEDYAVILSILERNLAVEDQRAYDRERKSHSELFLHRFHERFYAVRGEFFARDPVAWRQLMARYQPVLSWLRRRAMDVVLAIATAKDRSSVRILLEDL